MPHIFEPKFCPECGAALKRVLASHERGAPFVCMQCRKPQYLDPKLAVACVVEWMGKVILLRRAQRDNAHGLWILPGGHVDRGEEVTAAARRETAEELGLVVELDGLVGVYSYKDNPVVLIVYAAKVIGGNLEPSKEALETACFGFDELPWGEFGFISTGDALRDYIGQRGKGGERPENGLRQSPACAG